MIVSIPQQSINQVINVQEYPTINSSDTKMRIVFMNKKITLNKKSFYKILIWFKNNDKQLLQNFAFNLELKTKIGLLSIPPNKIWKQMETNEQCYLEFNLPIEHVSDFNQLYYNLVHDNNNNKGEINLNLNTDTDYIINELNVFENGISVPLFARTINSQLNDFVSNQTYKQIGQITNNLIDLNSSTYTNISPIKNMIDIIKNEIWEDNPQIEDFKIDIAEHDFSDFYKFKPSLKIIKSINGFKIICENNLKLNNVNQKIEEKIGDSGLLFNPYCKNVQTINLKFVYFGKTLKLSKKIFNSKISYDYFFDQSLKLFKKIANNEN
ncbi:hypothetical protein ESOMN_v1c01800 [Williamsoniiplasma somnilux]|uniref:Uncharacterized protein n=1 Tax=Williamsoniiplasma somnilux TaxID=215578 RepID=A0A2K8NXK2_9MOLU|nr:hypothetical protein [Williamsoniiplasma somnilux]ATZ18565.1 hypothetical protein ESOMN_v1c01800 [Williamsoniiplasma somnilux]